MLSKLLLCLLAFIVSTLALTFPATIKPVASKINYLAIDDKLGSPVHIKSEHYTWDATKLGGEKYTFQSQKTGAYASVKDDQIITAKEKDANAVFLIKPSSQGYFITTPEGNKAWTIDNASNTIKFLPIEEGKNQHFALNQ
ncbi:hypothetical protein BJ944DRAFT_270444 [Cunninghamella echinulata]|nr:hypothetical protein BJ944DRAFT_270444 [Cunninghamella echinulata]